MYNRCGKDERPVDRWYSLEGPGGYRRADRERERAVVPSRNTWILSVWVGWMFRVGNAGRKNEHEESGWRSVCQ